MIINRDLRFIFVHVPKTGGTSIAAALRRVPGGERFSLASVKHTTLAELYAHTSETEPALTEFRAFAFVRNPWDRFASLHRYLLRDLDERPRPVPRDFAAFVELLDAQAPWLERLHSVRPQCDFITDACRIGRFETLERDFARIGADLGFAATLPHRNATSAEPIHYRALYTSETADIIARRYAQDIERFGYEF